MKNALTYIAVGFALVIVFLYLRSLAKAEKDPTQKFF
jgi:uncharacterized membrane protein YuzA (DUF378 family)